MCRSVFACSTLAAFLAACGGQSPSPMDASRADGAADAACRAGGALKVMTQNLYLGADITKLVEAPADEVVAVATQLWNTVKQTHFPARAQVIADEMLLNQPDIVGLQEVTTWRIGVPVVCYTGNPNDTSATRVVYDYLDILLRALRERGLYYEVAAQTTTVDTELCIGNPADPNALRDLRYTDRDVLLVRHGVPWRSATVPPSVPGFVPAPIAPGPGDQNGGVYALALDDAGHSPATACFSLFPNSAPSNSWTSICDWRGWTAIEVRRADQWVRVFETHLEDWLKTQDGVPPWIIQALEAIQLVALIDGAYQQAPLPTLVIGDFNAYVTLTDQPPVYGYLIGDGTDMTATLEALVGPLGPLPPSWLSDGWTALHPDDPGFTWGFDELLYTGSLTTRLDLMLVSEPRPLFMKRIGVWERTSTGQHPSDHAGLIGVFASP